MRCLIDTNIFIWWMEKNKRLSKELMGFLNDPANLIFLSVASIWEMVIKKAKGRLKIPKDIKEGVQISRFSVLPIEVSHVLEVGKLAPFHSDPFDRLLIVQAKVENLTLITSDPKIWKYRVSVLRA